MAALKRAKIQGLLELEAATKPSSWLYGGIGSGGLLGNKDGVDTTRYLLADPGEARGCFTNPVVID